jgi:transcription elongation factor Elf1
MIDNLTGGQLRAGAEVVFADGRRTGNDEVDSSSIEVHEDRRRIIHPEQEHTIPCNYCDYKAVSVAGIGIHMSAKHQDEMGPKHTCTSCGLRFRTRQTMLRHARDLHKK